MGLENKCTGTQEMCRTGTIGVRFIRNKYALSIACTREVCTESSVKNVKFRTEINNLKEWNWHFVFSIED